MRRRDPRTGAPPTLFLFVDGLGLGECDPATNPVLGARLPTLRRLLDGALPLSGPPIHAATASLVGVDAVLGVDGVPQSGTGQGALLTGVNAPRLFGRHHGPYVPTSLRPLVADESLLARAVRGGRSVAFANAYPEEVLEMAAKGARTPLVAGPPLAARGAGLLTRHTAALEKGEAVASEITNDGWRERLGRRTLPALTPEEAGVNLARIAAAHDLTLFAHYATDAAGHEGAHAPAIAALERLDAFLAGILATLPADSLLVLASDHGNLEDVRTGHTRNPALAFVAGPGHRELAGEFHALTDIAPALLRRLGL